MLWGHETGVPDRLRSGDLLHERQACCLDYTTGTEMERVNGIAPLSRPWHGRILLLNHTRKNGVPSRTLTDNLTLRTRSLRALTYGTKTPLQLTARLSARFGSHIIDDELRERSKRNK